MTLPAQAGILANVPAAGRTLTFRHDGGDASSALQALAKAPLGEGAVIGLGPAAPREFVETIASADALTPQVDALRGGVIRLEDGLPRVRDVRHRPPSGAFMSTRYPLSPTT